MGLLAACGFALTVILGQNAGFFLQGGFGRARTDLAVYAGLALLAIWVLILLGFQVHNGHRFQYPKRIGGWAVHPSRKAYLTGLALVTAAGVAWVELWFRGFLMGRAADPEYVVRLQRSRYGPDAVSVDAVDNLIFVVYVFMGLTLLLHLVAQFFQPGRFR